MLDLAGASTQGASTCWNQRVSAGRVGGAWVDDDADYADDKLLLLSLKSLLIH